MTNEYDLEQWTDEKLWQAKAQIPDKSDWTQQDHADYAKFRELVNREIERRYED